MRYHGHQKVPGPRPRAVLPAPLPHESNVSTTDDNIAGTYRLHGAERVARDRSASVTEHNEVLHRTMSGDVYATRDGIELIPTPGIDPSDPLVCRSTV